MQLWKRSDVRQNAQRLIRFLLDRRSDTGWPIDWDTMAAWGELAYSAHPPLSRGMVLKVLSEMIEQGEESVEAFEQIHEKLQNTGREQSVKRWRYILPLEIEVPKDRLPLRLHAFGQNFYLIAASSLKRYLRPRSVNALPLALSQRCSFQREMHRYVYFTAVADASSWRDGWDGKVASAFDAFRGMLNLTLSFYQWRLTFNDVRPWGVRHPCWGVAVSDQREEEPFFFIVERGNVISPVKLSIEVIEALKRNLLLLKKVPRKGTTLELISDALRLYSQAMDTSLPHWRLLGFWQLAEAITASEDVGGDTSKVAHRLSWLGAQIGLEGSGYKYTLLALGRKRNQIVHRGIGDVDEEDINILKLACEAGIHWLFSVVNDLPTVQHIRQFYKFRDLSRGERQSIKETLEFIQTLSLP